MRKRKYALSAMLVTLTLVLAACDQSASPSASGSEAPGSQAPTSTPDISIDTGKGLCRLTTGQEAPSEAPPEPTGTSELLIGVVTDVGTLDDRNFNQFAWEGAQHGATTIGAPEPEAIVTQDESEYAANIQSFVDQDYDVIVTVGFAIGAATLEAAIANPDVHFIGVDQFQANDPTGNYESLIYNEAQAGFLGGLIAGSISESGEVVGLGGANFIPPVVNYLRGFQNGVLSVNADATVHVKYVTDSDLSLAFNDPTAGKAFADQFLAQNPDVDVLYQVAGKTGNGMLQSVEEAGIYGIGVDVDQWSSTPDSAECIVTSTEKKLKRSVSEAIVAFAADEGRDSNQFLGAAENMVGLAPYYQFSDLITDDVQTLVVDSFAAMAAGDLDPCTPNACYTGTPDPGT